MRRHSSTVTIGWTWEPEDAEGEIPESYDFEITGTLEPYDPGDRETPPSGGGVDDIQVDLVTIHTDAGTIPAKNHPRRREIEAAYEKYLYASKTELSSLETSLAERAGEYDEPDHEDY